MLTLLCAPHRSSYYLLFVYTQGSVRAFGTLATLGYEEVPCLKALVRQKFSYSKL